MHIVKNSFLKETNKSDIENNGDIKVFAVKTRNPQEMTFLATHLVTKLNPYGFMTYLKGGYASPVCRIVEPKDYVQYKRNRINSLGKAGTNAKIDHEIGETYLIFHEDCTLCYAENKETMVKRYPNILVYEYDYQTTNIKKIYGNKK